MHTRTEHLAVVGIDLWSWPLRGVNARISRMQDLLSASERMRAMRIKSDAGRHDFIFTRARTRQILARYSAVDPTELQFEYGVNGKPAIKSLTNIQFNLSHTSGQVVLAITQGYSVGVDIEVMRPLNKGLAERFFSAAENIELKKLNFSHWADAFFRIWTTKEAVSKALGLGLFLDFKTFDVKSCVDRQTLVIPTKNGTSVELNYRRFLCGPSLYGCVAAVTDMPVKLHCLEGDKFETFDIIQSAAEKPSL